MSEVDLRNTINSTPIECLDAEIMPRISLRAFGVPSFAPDPRYLDEKGRSRRIEWVPLQEHVDLLTGPLYNRPGRSPLFRIAKDLVDRRNSQSLAAQVGLVLEQEGAIAKIEAVESAVATLKAEIEDLKTEIEGLKAKKRAPRKPKEVTPQETPGE